MGGLQPRLRTAVRASGMPGEGSLVLRTYRTLDRPLARFSRRGRLTPGQRSKDLPSPPYHHRDATTRSSPRKLIDLGLMSLQRRGHSTAMCLRHVCPFADTSGNDPGRGGRSPRGLFLAMDLLRPGGYAGAGHGGSSRRPPNGSHASRAHPPALDGCRDVRDDVPNGGEGSEEARDRRPGRFRPLSHIRDSLHVGGQHSRRSGAYRLACG
jgi:hypothetical protein